MPEPHHEDPASSPKSTISQPKSQQRRNPLLRWTTVTVTLPPPIFFVPLLLAAIYFLFSSSSPQVQQQSCSLQSVPQVQTASLSSSTPNINKMATEQTFIAIKPDGVQRGLIGPIVSRFEQRGFKLVAIKLVTPGKAHLEAHYADLADKGFFAGLIEYMNSGPICAMIWEGRDAVKTGRTILGATNPLASAPGTIRGDYAIDVGRNVCHGSDTVENAQKEIALWFKEGEAVSYKASQFDWIYEKA
ncbi:nucleoside diphosphate kinase [Trichoderma gamsii]|uniref:Nucleoside diphosphate kinase n=1 Tax=Trichoderma gamsii TaxID=398673 RepID=A0A2P4ZIL5_9HYPO|nr:nucleoside diphosphate kinase [Trichoderma gamsii]PON24122.1 nucleoside diphosphate kinase [Trichoderma gamsii]